MDLFDKVEEITMTNLSNLYNIDPMPLAICGPPLAANPKQHRSGAKEELQERRKRIHH
jgi:hypothetical protein